MKSSLLKLFKKKIRAHIATEIFVAKTISYKILLHLAMKYFVTKTIFCIFVAEKFVTKTYFLFLFFSWL